MNQNKYKKFSFPFPALKLINISTTIYHKHLKDLSNVTLISNSINSLLHIPVLKWAIVMSLKEPLLKTVVKNIHNTEKKNNKEKNNKEKNDKDKNNKDKNNKDKNKKIDRNNNT